MQIVIYILNKGVLWAFARAPKIMTTVKIGEKWKTEKNLTKL